MVPLYAIPRSSSGELAAAIDCVDPVESLRASDDTSDLESVRYSIRVRRL